MASTLTTASGLDVNASMSAPGQEGMPRGLQRRLAAHQPQPRPPPPPQPHPQAQHQEAPPLVLPTQPQPLHENPLWQTLQQQHQQLPAAPEGGAAVLVRQVDATMDTVGVRGEKLPSPDHALERMDKFREVSRDTFAHGLISPQTRALLTRIGSPSASHTPAAPADHDQFVLGNQTDQQHKSFLQRKQLGLTPASTPVHARVAWSELVDQADTPLPTAQRAPQRCVPPEDVQRALRELAQLQEQLHELNTENHRLLSKRGVQPRVAPLAAPSGPLRGPPPPYDGVPRMGAGAQLVSLIQHMPDHAALCCTLVGQRNHGPGDTVSLLELLVHRVLNPFSTDQALTTGFLLKLAELELGRVKQQRNPRSPPFGIFFRTAAEAASWNAAHAPLVRGRSLFFDALQLYGCRCDVERYFRELWSIRLLAPAFETSAWAKSSDKSFSSLPHVPASAVRAQFVTGTLKTVTMLLSALTTDDAVAAFPAPATAVLQFLQAHAGPDAVDLMLMDLMILPAIDSLLLDFNPLPALGERHTADGQRLDLWWMQCVANFNHRLAHPLDGALESNLSAVMFVAWFVFHTAAKPIAAQAGKGTAGQRRPTPVDMGLGLQMPPDCMVLVRTACNKLRHRLTVYKAKLLQLDVDAGTGSPPNALTRSSPRAGEELPAAALASRIEGGPLTVHVDLSALEEVGPPTTPPPKGRSRKSPPRGKKPADPATPSATAASANTASVRQTVAAKPTSSAATPSPAMPSPASQTAIAKKRVRHLAPRPLEMTSLTVVSENEVRLLRRYVARAHERLQAARPGRFATEGALATLHSVVAELEFDERRTATRVGEQDTLFVMRVHDKRSSFLAPEQRSGQGVSLFELRSLERHKRTFAAALELAETLQTELLQVQQICEGAEDAAPADALDNDAAPDANLHPMTLAQRAAAATANSGDDRSIATRSTLSSRPLARRSSSAASRSRRTDPFKPAAAPVTVPSVHVGMRFMAHTKSAISRRESREMPLEHDEFQGEDETGAGWHHRSQRFFGTLRDNKPVNNKAAPLSPSSPPPALPPQSQSSPSKLAPQPLQPAPGTPVRGSSHMLASASASATRVPLPDHIRARVVEPSAAPVTTQQQPSAAGEGVETVAAGSGGFLAGVLSSSQASPAPVTPSRSSAASAPAAAQSPPSNEGAPALHPLASEDFFTRSQRLIKRLTEARGELEHQQGQPPRSPQPLEQPQLQESLEADPSRVPLQPAAPAATEPAQPQPQPALAPAPAPSTFMASVVNAVPADAATAAATSTSNHASSSEAQRRLPDSPRRARAKLQPQPAQEDFDQQQPKAAPQQQDDSIQNLIAGVEVTKHGRKGLPKKRLLRMDEAMSRVTWDSSKSSAHLESSILVDDLRRVLLGRTTDMLQRSGVRSKEECCLSVVATTRTLDLECASGEQRDQLAAAFRALIDLHKKLDL